MPYKKKFYKKMIIKKCYKNSVIKKLLIRFVPWDVFSLGRFVLGCFILGRFVCASYEAISL